MLRDARLFDKRPNLAKFDRFFAFLFRRHFFVALEGMILSNSDRPDRLTYGVRDAVWHNGWPGARVGRAPQAALAKPFV